MTYDTWKATNPMDAELGPAPEDFTGLPSLEDAVSILLANAETIPDPRMDGTTDCIAVSFEDIDVLRAVLRKSDVAKVWDALKRVRS